MQSELQTKQQQSNQQNIYQKPLNYPQIELTITEIKAMRKVFANQKMTVQQLYRLIRSYQQDKNQIKLKIDQIIQVEKQIIVFKHLKKCLINTMILYSNKFSYYFFKEIKSVEFQNLKQLNLSNNHIQNIEPLTYLLNCVNLQNLQLQNNKIYNLKSLSRTKFNKLNTLELSTNPIIQTGCLARMKFKTEKYFNLYIFSQVDEFNISPLFKLEIKKLAEYALLEQNQEDVHKMLELPTSDLIYKFSNMTLRRFLVVQTVRNI